MKNKDELYAKWLSGEISDEELRAIEGDDAVTDLERVIKTVDQLSMPKYDTVAGYEKFKKAHPTKSAKVRKINWFVITGLAASILLVIAFWSTFQQNANETLFAEHGQNLKTLLDDGSQILLNDGSKVVYNTKKWTDQRVIELTGEALFEVTKGNPFIVNTENGSIRVLGTQFNVKAWGNQLYVECYEGKVQVSVDNQEVILTAKEAVSVVEGKMNVKQEITNETPAWQNGMSRFHNEKLQDVFAELERQYNIKVNIKVTNRSFSGSFRHNDLEEALRSICKPLGLNYTIDKNQKTVVID